MQPPGPPLEQHETGFSSAEATADVMPVTEGALPTGASGWRSATRSRNASGATRPVTRPSSSGMQSEVTGNGAAVRRSRGAHGGGARMCGALSPGHEAARRRSTGELLPKPTSSVPRCHSDTSSKDLNFTPPRVQCGPSDFVPNRIRQQYLETLVEAALKKTNGDQLEAHASAKSIEEDCYDTAGKLDSERKAKYLQLVMMSLHKLRAEAAAGTMTDSSGDIDHDSQAAADHHPSEQATNDEVIRTKQMQIAKLRVNMNEMKDQLDEAVTSQNFIMAQEIKSKMDQLEEEQIVLENQLSAAKAASATDPLVPVFKPGISNDILTTTDSLLQLIYIGGTTDEGCQLATLSDGTSYVSAIIPQKYSFWFR